VNDPEGVGVGDGDANLQDELNRLLHRQSAAIPDPVG